MGSTRELSVQTRCYRACRQASICAAAEARLSKEKAKNTKRDVRQEKAGNFALPYDSCRAGTKYLFLSEAKDQADRALQVVLVEA